MVRTGGYAVAVVGATGAVGREMVRLLEHTSIPIKQIKLLSSARSAGTTIHFKGDPVVVEEAMPSSFEGVDIALFSAGGGVSKALAPHAVERGAIVIDNTSAYRMDPDVPLVVPEVNSEAIRGHRGIIANPNCSTIQMVVALEPLRRAFGLKRVIVSTYQAVSGAGYSALEELENESRAVLDGKPSEPSILPVKSDKRHYSIAFNAIPQIDKFQDDLFTFEEAKMMNETKKIMGDETIAVAATCVRLPIMTGHAESVYVELDNDVPDIEAVRKLLSKAPGVTLMDDPDTQTYPMPIQAAGKKEVFVGRARKDLDVPNGLHLWVVSDNLLKGAAWNSVQIAESLVASGLINY
ncbi:aspartate-semialdehyde dehydrogenase [Camelliibacillus cellulosilyticus]|uniref:Aspartate-semialdehyde dehydrogenase n=1 Tax=Camelliibacillus cellulosilyticus TaxID=2174486 RepID=A0ABV9GL56_9BACL